VNYPSNPIGATAPLSYYEHVVAFAREKGILAISDNAYADLYFSPDVKPHSLLEVPGALECAIEFHSLSKPYSLTGWRIGYAAGSKAAIDLLALVKSAMDSGLFKGIQKVGIFALSDPGMEQHMQDVSRIYARNQEVTLAGLKRLGWPVEEIYAPQATFYLWVPIPPRYTSCVEFSEALLKTSGVVVVPGTAFGSHGEGFIRLSLVLPEEKINAVFDRMAADGFTYNG
jgi:LL-diaminopimelate aminotransferase